MAWVLSFQFSRNTYPSWALLAFPRQIVHFTRLCTKSRLCICIVHLFTLQLSNSTSVSHNTNSLQPSQARATTIQPSSVLFSPRSLWYDPPKHCRPRSSASCRPQQQPPPSINPSVSPPLLSCTRPLISHSFLRLNHPALAREHSGQAALTAPFPSSTTHNLAGYIHRRVA